MRRGIIKNYQKLIAGSNKSLRENAIDIIEAAIEEAIPYRKTCEALSVQNGFLQIGQYRHPLEEIRHLYVIGVGKGAFPIAKAIEEKVGDYITEGYVLVKDGDTRRLNKIQIAESAHPLPDQRGIDGGKRILEILHKAGEGDIILAAITGGSSAMVNVPAGNITLKDLCQINELLLKSGADIGQMNAVRKHLGLLKGGRMITYAAPALVYTFTLNTAPPNMPWPDLALPDPTTFQDAVDVMKKFELWEEAPESVKERLLYGIEHPELETPKKFESNNSFIVNVADPQSACMAAARRAEELGYEPHILSTCIEGEAKDLGIILAGISNHIAYSGEPFKKPCALISAGETTVTIHGKCGEGGPNQETSLGFALKTNYRQAVCVSVDSDGTDGPCEIAGGITDLHTAERAKEEGIDIVKALLEHDSKNVLEKLEGAIVTGHTGTNIMNLRLVLIE